MTTRVFEGVCGVFAALWGILLEGYLVFGPSGTFVQSDIGSGATTTSGHTGLAGAGIGPATIVSLSLLAVFFLTIGASAVFDSQRRDTPIFRAILITATVLLGLFSCAAIASIGYLLLPSLVLAVVAVILSGRDAGNQRRARSSA